MQKSPFLVFLVLAWSLILSCTSNSHHYLVGVWDMPQGPQVMIFHEDSTIQWIFNDNLVSDTFHLKYKLDETKTPRQIDLYNFNAGILKDKMLVGIIDHISKDSIVLDFKPIDNWSQADSARPTVFDPENKRVLIKKI